MKAKAKAKMSLSDMKKMKKMDEVQDKKLMKKMMSKKKK